MALYQMTVKATKVFYVEANSQEEAIHHPASVDEFDSTINMPFEPDEMMAVVVTGKSEEHARDRESHLILE